MVTTLKDDNFIILILEIGNPQPSPSSFNTYGCSSQTKCWWGFFFRYKNLKI